MYPTLWNIFARIVLVFYVYVLAFFISYLIILAFKLLLHDLVEHSLTTNCYGHDHKLSHGKFVT